MRKQTGFTLIELIVVMIILGVLATTALPKFMDVTSQSHEAAVAGTGGAFGSAVSLAHAQWIANGHVTSIDDLAGFGDGTIDTSTSGWPTDTAGNNDLSTATHCIHIWNGLMQNPPTAVTGSSTKASLVQNGEPGMVRSHRGCGTDIRASSRTFELALVNVGKASPW